MQQITRGDYLQDLITIYVENNLETDITDLYSQFVFQCGDIQKFLTPAPVIKISFDEQESQLLRMTNTCYLAGITIDGHKETFNGSLTFNTRGEVVFYEPPASTVMPSGTTIAPSCTCQDINGFFSNCSQSAIKAYFSLNYLPTKLSQLENDTDFVDSFDVTRAVSIHNTSTEAHTYIQDLIATEASLRVSQTNALHVSIEAETTAREEAVSLAISTTEGYTDSSVSVHNSSTEAHPYIQSVLTSTTEAIRVDIGDLTSLTTSTTSSIVGAINSEVSDRQSADNNLQTQIDGLAAASDVTDIVGTYAELEAYDTQHLNNNDIIKVLTDETHDNQPSYYRYNKLTDTFSYIGSESAAYTKAQSDSIFVTKTTTINNKALSSDITLNASDVGALSSSTTITNLASTTQMAAINSGVTTTVVAQVGTNATNIATNTSAIASNTSAIIGLKDLSNLSSTGNLRLHALKGYVDAGELLTDAEGLADVIKYAHNNYNSTLFTVTGSPTIIDGVASGFSSSNKLSVTLPATITTNDTFEFDVMFTTPAAFSGTQTIWALSNSYRIYQGSAGAIYCIFWGQNVGFQATTSTTYLVKFIYNGSKLSVKYRKDTDTAWSSGNEATVSSGTTQTNPTFDIGIQGSNNPYNGSINLKYFAVKVNGSLVVSGNKTGIDTIKPDDYTKVGTPTISADGVVSNLSTSNYITALSGNKISNSGKVKYSFNCINCSQSSGGIKYYGTIRCTTLNSSYINLALGVAVNSTKIQLNGSGEGGAQYYIDINYSNIANFDINKLFNVDIYIEGTGLTFELSQNNIILDTRSAILLGTPTESYIQLGNQQYDNGSTRYNAWVGSIDLNSIKIYVDGNLVYQPCLKIPYALSKTGSKIVDGVYRDRVVDCYNYEGYAPYYTLDEVNGNFTLPMGEIYGEIEKAKTRADYTSSVNTTELNGSGNAYTIPYNCKAVVKPATPASTYTITVNGTGSGFYGYTELDLMTGDTIYTNTSATAQIFKIRG